MSYLALKHLHVSFAVLSGILFFIRGLLMLADSPALKQRMLRIVPHAVDTLLLASAVGLVVWSGQYPLAQTWLTVKLLGLVAYIVLGVVAFRLAKSKGARLIAFLAALGVFGYIVMVAVTRQPF